MKKIKLFKRIQALFLLVLILSALSVPIHVAAAAEPVAVPVEATDSTDSVKGDKALAAAICVGLAAGCGAIGMGIAIGKSAESIGRQPEAEGKIRTSLMLGLVFIETAIIYALIVAILVIFVL